jgi:ribose transport system ATP-binding protein/putative multiple sugar transport system ATP-binding protein
MVEIAHWSTFDEFDRERPAVVDATVVAEAGQIVGLAGLDDSGRNELLLSVYGRTAGTPPTGAVLLQGVSVDTSTTTAAVANGIFMIATVQPKYRVRIVGGISAPVAGSMLPALLSAGLASRDEGDGPSSPGGRALDLVRSRGRDDEWVRIRSLLELFPQSEHRVLLLVEPTRGLDAAQRAEVWRLLELVRASGKAVLLSSADLDELVTHSDRIVAMADGRVVGEFGAGASALEVVRAIAPH